MKNLKISKFNWLFVLVLAFVYSTYGQKQIKKKTENFTVNKDVTININTSYTDIEFETWNKNTVSVEAILEFENATKEEAEEYFKNWDFEASGNSNEVTIKTRGGGVFVFSQGDFDFPEGDFQFVMPDIEIPDIVLPEIAPFVFEMPETPPLPPLALNSFNTIHFDYEAYKKDGDVYLKKWKKQFNEQFDEEFKKEIEIWRKEMEVWKKEHGKQREELKKQREEQREEMSKVREKQRKEMAEQRKELAKVKQQIREQTKAIQAEVREKVRKSGKSNTFYFSSEGSDKNLKVKKIIKIKMPKDAKLKMNVRHGEVKLSENSKNIKATLSHTRLLAQVIDGEYTDIEASYSPIMVDNWNYGQLKVNYVKDVDLKNVKSLKLTSNSSDVTIGAVINNAIINGSFGELSIGTINDNFSSVDINLENTEAILVLPKGSFSFYCNGSNSEISYPKGLTVDVTKNYSNKLIKGYHKQKNTDKSIHITAKYSDVVMQ